MTALYGNYDLYKLASPDDSPSAEPVCSNCEQEPVYSEGLCENCLACLDAQRYCGDVADLVRAVREHLRGHSVHVYGLSGIVARFPEMEETR